MNYGLIGEKLGHSFSKVIHEKLAEYTYDLQPLTREEFHAFMKLRDFKAINVTIPYKQDVIPYLDEVDENARTIGAVNTIVHKNGRLIGHNTDFYGFLYTLEHNQIQVKNKKVVILGCGGASKAVLAVIRHQNASEIILVNRSAKEGAISYDACYASHTDAQIIINTTPVGMYPNITESPIDLLHFPQCEAVIDIVYNPLETKLLNQAKKLGIKGVNGLEMLVAQAKYAVEYFLDTKIDDHVIEPIVEDFYH